MPSGCGSIPADLLQSWYDPIMWGVLSRMMNEIGKPYSNPQMALYWRRMFKSKVGEARVDADKRYMVTNAPWQFPGFA